MPQDAKQEPNALLPVLGSKRPACTNVEPLNPFSVALSKRKERKARRRANTRFQAKVAGKPVRSLITTGALIKNIVKLLGLLDRKVHGPLCRLGDECPAFSKIGPHNGSCSYHLWPQRGGGQSRLLPLNIVWACHAANCGEKWNRRAYYEKALRIFGADRMARIEETAKITADYSRSELFELREKIKAELGRPLTLPGDLV